MYHMKCVTWVCWTISLQNYTILGSDQNVIKYIGAKLQNVLSNDSEKGHIHEIWFLT